jgi:hypothetical protein
MYWIFFKKFFSTTMIAILLIITINYLVDPFNVHSFIKIQGFNHDKPECQSRLSVALNIIRYQPKTIVLGTSRAVCIERNCLGPHCEEPFLNAAFGGASFDEIYAYFLHALHVEPDLKKVFLGIDLFSFNANRKPQVDYKAERLQKNSFHWKDMKDLLLSYRALSASCQCFYESFREGETKNPILEMGENNYLQAMLKSQENYKDYKIDPEKVKRFQELVEICHTRGIELQVFVSPVKALYWEFYYQHGLWPHVEELKRQLCAFYPIWDFSGYNLITMETLDSCGKKIYYECSHFTPYIGNLLIKRMFGETSSIDTVGYLLSPETVEFSLAEILEQRSQWVQAQAEARAQA